ncbi:MAG: hypothetical protein M1827_004335 [Pycnora praestabilis]|nr:MAG: hypothetical protein M1827_004335 [Pycnora praestabilis]
MRAVVPHIRNGGVNVVYVMPNLVPPITTVAHALAYQSELKKIEPRVEYLMSLYLHPSITPDTVIEAKKAGITGIKSYPAGLTTNSSSGVVSYEAFYPVFAEMEKQDMILNLHGESPSGKGVTVMSAEESFLPTFLDLHARFPNLRIILEHCTSAKAVEAVKTCGPSVAATITGKMIDSLLIAKLPKDRETLLKAATSGNPKFFLGTDSAPHPMTAKTGGLDRQGKVAAGVFTQPYATQYVLDAFEQGCSEGILRSEDITKEVLENFLGGFGRHFYRVVDTRKERIVLKKRDEVIVGVFKDQSQDAADNVEIVPFRRGMKTWSVEWK